jgi:sugar lactone lactonase YvrE
MPDLHRRTLIALLAAVAASRAQAQGAPDDASKLTQVATFEQQVTGIAVSPQGRIFVNFPRWEKDVEISVAEVMKDGSLKPYPNAEWNAWRNLKPLSNGDHFVCVQSVTVDPQGFLWILDPAAPGNEFNLDGGPKLVKVDLASDKVLQVIRFGRDTIPQGSYLNDVRVSPDGRWAYITDSGVRGALLVVDLLTGKPRRVLDGHPSTQVEPDVIVHADGQELRRPDNRKVKFSADGIALDRQGRFLYWQALTGKTLCRLPTNILTNPTVAPARLAAAVTKVGTTNVADGLWMDGKGNIWVTSPEEDALKLRAPDGTMQTVVQDKRLRWPDSLAEGPDGSIYVTSSHIQDMAQWHEKGSTLTEPYALWKVAGR